MRGLIVIYLCSISTIAVAVQPCIPGTPIQQRVRHAPVVFHGLTMQPSITSESGKDGQTQFWLIDVYKGSSALSKVLDTKLPETGVLDVRDRKVNVSGALKIECGLQLSEGGAQRHYIVMATVEDRSLVALEHDATLEPWTSNVDTSIWQALGWSQWSDWSACTVSCGEGVQHRSRHCRQAEHCEGYNKQTRRCNMFPCRGAVSPLQPDQKRYLQGQWTKTPDRPTAWRVHPSSYLWLPAMELPVPTTHLRKHFALLLTLRLHSKETSTGTLFSLRSRSASNAYLSLELSGRDAVRLVHSNNNSTQTVLIPTPLGDGHWHQLALGVQQDSSVHSYLDCHWVSTDILRRDSLDIPEDADLVIGYLFSGDLEQLVLVADPSLASQQCATSLESSVEPEELPATFHRSKLSKDQRRARKHHRTEITKVWNTKKDNEIQIDDEDIFEGSGAGTPLEQYEYVWSEWSRCSVTCGMGVQTRKVACSEAGVWMDLCLEAGKEKTETRPCNAPPCTRLHDEPTVSNVTSSRRKGNACGCQNGGTCHTKRQACHCPPGFQGLRCEIRSCPGPCLHGGVCHNSGYCSCPPEYTGDTCQTPVCQPPCMNGGQCIKPGVCSCPTQFNHPRCAALCPGGCEPGGACVSPGVCQCRPGFRGSLCQESLCPRGCFNGATCVAQNVCNCTPGWTGFDCSIPVCDPPCQRGGQCVGPQQCLCPAATLGSRCQNFTCTVGCVNGGVCVGPNLCECPANATGPSCAQPLCDPPCENGATCAQGNTCLCSSHTSGTRCQTKNCDYRFVQEPYTRGYKKLLKKRIETKCGEGSKSCYRTVAEYQTLYKTFYHTVYKCTSDQAR